MLFFLFISCTFHSLEIVVMSKGGSNFLAANDHVNGNGVGGFISVGAVACSTLLCLGLACG